MAKKKDKKEQQAIEQVTNRVQFTDVAANCDHLENIDIQALIRVIRGVEVILDSDLAMLYGVENKRLNEQVKRNITRFPDDFMFQLNTEETKNLKSQFATSSWGGKRKNPYAFTRNGVAMLSSVLRSETAIGVNIRIMRAFTAIPKIVNQSIQMVERIVNIEHHQQETDGKIELIFDRIEKLSPKRPPNKSSQRAACGMHGHTYPTWFAAPNAESSSSTISLTTACFPSSPNAPMAFRPPSIPDTPSSSLQTLRNITNNILQ